MTQLTVEINVPSDIREGRENNTLAKICRICPALIEAVLVTASDREGIAAISCTTALMFCVAGTTFGTAPVRDACLLNSQENYIPINFVPDAIPVNVTAR